MMSSSKCLKAFLKKQSNEDLHKTERIFPATMCINEMIVPFLKTRMDGKSLLLGSTFWADKGNLAWSFLSSDLPLWCLSPRKSDMANNPCLFYSLQWGHGSNERKKGEGRNRPERSKKNKKEEPRVSKLSDFSCDNSNLRGARCLIPYEANQGGTRM